MSAKMRAFELLVNEAADLWDGGSEDYQAALVDLVCRSTGLDTRDFGTPVQDIIVARENPFAVSEMTVARSMKTIRDALTGLRVRLICGYQLLSEMAGHQWAEHVLGQAKAEGRVIDFEHFANFSGDGIQYPQFALTVEVPPEIEPGDPEWHAKMRSWGTSLVNLIVGDSDAEVHFIASIPEGEES